VRECKALLNERIRHVNRIKGLLFNQGISVTPKPGESEKSQAGGN